MIVHLQLIHPILLNLDGQQVGVYGGGFLDVLELHLSCKSLLLVNANLIISKNQVIQMQKNKIDKKKKTREIKNILV